MNKERFADLHIHTVYSDGYHTPEEVVEKAVSRGLCAIAIVDHDEIGALETASQYGSSRGVEVIAGVELSVSYHQHDLHILGYCFNHRNPDLISYLDLFKKERVKRAERIVSKLSTMGMPISLDAVLKKSGDGSVGRPHIANVLLEDGFVKSFQEAFNKYIAYGKPAYVDKYKVNIDTVLQVIRDAGGICSIAHPGIQLTDSDLMDLIKTGIECIEVIHPKHSNKEVGAYTELAEAYGLLQTGGSDFHGGKRGEENFGKYKIPYETVCKIMERSTFLAQGGQ